jgi:hypothetical protein
MDLCKFGNCFELGRVFSAPLLDPLEGLFTVDFFQPQIGIFVCGDRYCSREKYEYGQQ